MARPKVSSPSSLANRPLRKRSTSPRGIGTSLKCFWPGFGSGFGEPCRNNARMPDSSRPRIAASVCSGVGLLWHQSTSVVAPLLIWLSAPIRLAMWMSSGRNSVARPRCIACMYSATVQSAASPRRPVCQVCRWPLISPGSTSMCDRVDHGRIAGGDIRRHGGDPVAVYEDVALTQVSDCRIHADDGGVFNQREAHAGSLMRDSTTLFSIPDTLAGSSLWQLAPPRADWHGWPTWTEFATFSADKIAKETSHASFEIAAPS